MRPAYLLAPDHSGLANSKSHVEGDYRSASELFHMAKPGYKHVHPTGTVLAAMFPLLTDFT